MATFAQDILSAGRAFKCSLRTFDYHDWFVFRHLYIFNYSLQECKLGIAANRFFYVFLGKFEVHTVASFAVFDTHLGTRLSKVADKVVHCSSHQNGHILLNLPNLLVFLHYSFNLKRLELSDSCRSCLNFLV